MDIWTRHPDAVPATGYKLDRWPTSGRPWRPYMFEQVTIVPGPALARLRRPSEKRETLYLLDPIGLQLLQLTSEDPESFITFVRRYGLAEFLEWGVEIKSEAWETIWDSYQRGVRHFYEAHLITAWTDPDAAAEFTTQKALLARAYEDAARFPEKKDAPRDPGSHLRSILAQAWELQACTSVLEMDDETAAIFEYPSHIFARAWYELIETVTARRFPKKCEYKPCGALFVPGRRTSQKYCNPNHRDLAFRSRSDQILYLRQYQAMYKRMSRGKMTRDQFRAWTAAHKPPKKQAKGETS